MPSTSTGNNLVLGGAEGKLLKLLGFDIQITMPEWLTPPYKWLMSVRHTVEDPGSTVLIPLDPENDEDFQALVGLLIETQPKKMWALNLVMPAVGGCHEPGVRYDPFAAALEPSELQRIRLAKEQAIMDQDFDLAANLRDQERKLQRESRRHR